MDIIGHTGAPDYRPSALIIRTQAILRRPEQSSLLPLTQYVSLKFRRAVRERLLLPLVVAAFDDLLRIDQRTVVT